jgi:hypothetical protein
MNATFPRSFRVMDLVWRCFLIQCPQFDHVVHKLPFSDQSDLHVRSFADPPPAKRGYGPLTILSPRFSALVEWTSNRLTQCFLGSLVTL